MIKNSVMRQLVRFYSAFERRIMAYQKSRLIVKSHPTAKTSFAESADVSGIIVVGAESECTIGEGAVIEATIRVGVGCRVNIGAGSVLRNLDIEVRNQGVCDLDREVVINPPDRFPATISVDGGRLVIGRRAVVSGEMMVRFGGELSIGEHVGVSYGCEIRCEQQVTIGSYTLLAYDVCIYDTNTHSTNWRERRERIEKGYPYGAAETTRQQTAPVAIGCDVWVGKGAVILKGSVIGDRSIVGIKAVVPGAVYPADSLIVAPGPRILKRDQA
jgi:acetyltransferase-like isoleucine patch superfamily enzyme